MRDEECARTGGVRNILGTCQFGEGVLDHTRGQPSSSPEPECCLSSQHVASHYVLLRVTVQRGFPFTSFAGFASLAPVLAPRLEGHGVVDMGDGGQ